MRSPSPPTSRLSTAPGTTAPRPSSADTQFQLILKDYGSWLRKTVRRLCPRGLGIQPEDVEQDVALRLWRALGRKERIENPVAFLHRVAATATIDAMRRARAQREGMVSRFQESGPDDEVGVPAPIDPAPSPERAASDRQILAQVSQALGRLPEKRRNAVKLYLQGFKIQEIADFLGWTEPKARNLLYRGLRTLRQDLEDAGFEYKIP